MTSTVYIAKNVYGGDGLGRLGDGRVVFVPGAFAGENVKAEIVEEKNHYVKARLVEIAEPSPERIGTGGMPVPGMVYSNLSEAAEKSAKEQQLVDFFERARIPIPKPVRLEGGPAFNYRNKAVYHFGRPGGRWAIGYRREPSHEIQDVAEDPLVRPEINAKLGEIRRNVTMLLTTGPEPVRRDIARKGNVTVRWSARSGVQWWIGEPKGGTVIKETTCGRTFEVPADGFYQVNPTAGEALVRAVVGAYQKGAAEAGDVLDLYCGVGVFGLSCRPPKLIGVESGRQAVEFAKRNAAAQGMGAARFFCEEVGRNLKRIPVGPRTTVILDPPRGGLEPKVPEFLAMSRAPRLFYVSCDPATLMRDLRVIARAYDVTALSWVDMFPRTARFETFVELTRKA